MTKNTTQNYILKPLKPKHKVFMNKIIDGTAGYIRNKNASLTYGGALTVLFYETEIWINKDAFIQLSRKITQTHLKQAIMTKTGLILGLTGYNYSVFVYISSLEVSTKALLDGLKRHLLTADLMRATNFHEAVATMSVVFAYRAKDAEIVYFEKKLRYSVTNQGKIIPMFFIGNMSEAPFIPNIMP